MANEIIPLFQHIATNPPAEYKKALTPQERIKCAYLHLLRGVPQQDLAVAFEVNGGRVNEAVKAILKAAQDPKKFVNGDDADTA